MLGLGSGLRLLLSRGSRGHGGRLGDHLLLLGLLGGNVGESGSVEELNLFSDSGVDGLVDNGLEPTSNVGIGLSPSLVVEVLEATSDDTSSEEIGKGDALANEVGVGQEMLLDNIDSPSGKLGRLIDVLLVVRDLAQKRAVPAGEAGKDLLVEEGEPLQDGSVTTLVSSMKLLNALSGNTYSCLVLPRRVVFSFWEVTRGRVSRVPQQVVVIKADETRCKVRS